jgi:putative tryptophan/tyrosine transport system substrate-binding protein
MNKKQLLIVIVIGLGALVGIEYLFVKQNDVKSADYRVALFVPAVHPAMVEILDGFKQTVTAEGNKKYSFDDYNANGNATLLRAQADEIVQSKYDVVFTVGAQCSQSIFELSKKRQSNMPQVFTAVDDPVEMGIVRSLNHPGGMVTGTTDNMVYEQQIDALLRVKPDIKTMLLVYNPAQGRGFEKDREKLEKVLHAKHITLRTVAVTHQNEITQKVASFLDGVDVLIIFTDHTTVAGIDSLITLCGRYHITLFASDLNSGDKGAALAFGVLQKDYGVLGAKIAHRILEDKQSPASIAVRPLEQLYLKINTKTMEQQGLHVSKDKLVQLQKEGVILV